MLRQSELGFVAMACLEATPAPYLRDRVAFGATTMPGIFPLKRLKSSQSEGTKTNRPAAAPTKIAS